MGPERFFAPYRVDVGAAVVLVPTFRVGTRFFGRSASRILNTLYGPW